MSTVVPVQLDNGLTLYMEAPETGQISGQASSRSSALADQGEGEQRRGGAKGMMDFHRAAPRPTPAQSMEMLQSTIRTYTLYCLNAFKNVGSANVDEVTLEFGIGVSADAGVPYIASGKAQSNLKITVKCTYNQGEQPEIAVAEVEDSAAALAA